MSYHLLYIHQIRIFQQTYWILNFSPSNTEIHNIYIYIYIYMLHQSIRHGNKSVRGVSVDVAGRFPQDDFYFQNIKCFHGTRVIVIPLRPQGPTYGLPNAEFLQNSYKLNRIMCRSLLTSLTQIRQQKCKVRKNVRYCWIGFEA
jgi:hypothetical protein